MTWCEHRIWAAALAAYPQVKLFVAHTMDMENYYKPSKPHYSWPEEQLRRMRELLKDSNGRLLIFFAFDPARNGWRDAVKLGQTAGCAGVKFYPPNGYPPFDLSSGTIPRNSREFFAFCIDQQIPILTHCTSHGFEAKKGNGRLYADPQLWRRVLEKKGLDRLQLCFGHAGGEQGWFPRPIDLGSLRAKPFSTEVLALCREFPNVYCELAYLSPILQESGRERFQTALRTALKVPAAFPLAKKLMYGSDWHMIHTLQDHRLYLPSFISALEPTEWDLLRNDFFFRNAIRWLDLPAYIERTAKAENPWFNETARSYLESLCVLAGNPARTGNS